MSETPNISATIEAKPTLGNTLTPRKPYLHFWRAQFDKAAVGIIVFGLITWATIWPEHAWIDTVKGWTGQAVVLLLLLLRRGTWSDPTTPPHDGEGDELTPVPEPGVESGRPPAS